MIKPAYRTSEFWFTLVSFIFSGLYLTGIIDDHTNKEELISVVSHAVESVILIGGQFVVLSRYLKKRNEQKIEYEKTKQKEQENIKKELEDYIGVGKEHNTININEASLGELIQLPHIGPYVAEQIINYRKTNRFDSVLDLLKIKGIGENTFRDIEPYITL